MRRQDSGTIPSRAERRQIARVHRGIEKAQADVRRRARQQASQPRLAPISAAKAREYASHPHPQLPRFGLTSSRERLFVTFNETSRVQGAPQRVACWRWLLEGSA